jgi:hypothetical protein
VWAGEVVASFDEVLALAVGAVMLDSASAAEDVPEVVVEVSAAPEVASTVEIVVILSVTVVSKVVVVVVLSSSVPAVVLDNVSNCTLVGSTNAVVVD